MPSLNKPKQGGKPSREYTKGTFVEPRYHTTHWRNLRASVLQASPLCKACEDVGLITLAQMVDHILRNLIHYSVGLLYNLFWVF